MQSSWNEEALMKSALHAWDVVCPDVLVRHLPYINRGDA